ncbi:hypothetical protein [Aeoliella sp.]|uniref:hypothetical protein n=1 Tax=Aeoliella sp. TaxID=2795800 RepID=UPI003CCBF742
MSKDTAQRRLDNALEELSRVFRNYRGTAHWGDMTDSSVTIKHSVWELSEEEFKDFGWHSVCGPPGELKQAVQYFLPRVARNHSSTDLMNRQTVGVWFQELFVKLLNDVEWQQWDAEEVATVREWIFARIQNDACHDSWWVCDDATQFAAFVGCDLNDFFDDFRNSHPTTCILWLASEIGRHWDTALKSGWPREWQKNYGIPTPSRVAEQFLLLLLRKSSRELLEQVFLEDVLSDEHQSLVSSALEHANQCIEFGHVWPDAPLGRVLASAELDH